MSAKLFSTTCETLYLGWDAPLLPRAVTTLRDRYAGDKRWAMDGIDCVLPSAHGVRRLGELLRREAASSGLRLDPPTIYTIGQLAEQLYRPPAPVALEFEQTLAWAGVLRQVGAEQLAPLIPVLPPAEPIGPWLELAGAIRGLHEELSSRRMTFSDVVAAAETEAERRRWNLLRDIQASYLHELDAAGLCDPFSARQQAVMQNRCRSDRTIILIGTSDLSDSMVEMLRAMESPLIALVAAPPGEANRFDEFGCVDPSRWLTHHLPIADQQLIAAGDMMDQGAAVAEVVAEFAPRFAAEELTVGVTDESQVGPIEVELRGCGVATHRQLGWEVSNTAVGRLFDLTAAHLQQQTWQSLAALVRHADVHKLVSAHLADSAGGWLTQLDQLLADHFPVRVADPLPPRAVSHLPLAKELGEFMSRWLSCFDLPDQPLASWSFTVTQWLGTIFGNDWQDASEQDASAVDDARPRSRLALAAVGRILSRFQGLSQRLDAPLSGAVSMELLSARLAEVRVVEPSRPGEVEIVGWLDLALDDAPAMVVNGLNHPFVPRAVTVDPFLPGSLRTRLPVADNDRRYARDVYAMQLMLSTRSSIRFMVGRSAADQSPTPPSRLIAAAEPRDIARRVRSLLGSPREKLSVRHRWDQGSDPHQLRVPTLDVRPDAVSVLSVTAFRDYLICPYRFYLRHVLRLRPLDDSANELAANQFGDLIHGAVEWWGRSPHKDESDPLRIEQQLLDYLHQYAADRYSAHVSTAVQIQVAQAERRLKAVAVEQAKRRAEGWSIDRVEASVGREQDAKIVVDGEPFYVKGRFDRIDVCSRDGQQVWAILDYKSHGHPPEKKHLRKTDSGYEWIDLQLPLYRLMVPFLGIKADPRDVVLGYFNISDRDNETRINEASFSDELMTQAEALIHDCIRRIRTGDFEPSQDRVDYDDYGMILQTGVAGSMMDRWQKTESEETES